MYISIYEYLSDYDNLAEDSSEWIMRMKEGIKHYNREFKAHYNNSRTVIRKYKAFKLNKIYEKA